MRYGFFNSVDGDRKYNANDVNNIIKCIYQDGLVKIGNYTVEVYAYGGNKLAVTTGFVICNSHIIYNDYLSLFTVTANTTSSSRTDYIYAYCNESNRTCGLGYNAGSMPTSTSTTTYVTVATIVMPAGATTPDDSNITRGAVASVNADIRTNQLQYLKETSFNYFEVENSTTLVTSFSAYNAANRIIDGTCISNVYVNGIKQLTRCFDVSVSGSTIYLRLLGDSFVYCKNNSNFGQNVIYEQLYNN